MKTIAEFGLAAAGIVVAALLWGFVQSTVERIANRRAALSADLCAAGERHPAGKKPTIAERQDDRLDPYGPTPVPYTIASGGREGWLSPDEADVFAALVAEYERDGAR